MDFDLRMELAARVRTLPVEGMALILGYLVGRFVKEPNANFWRVLYEAFEELPMKKKQ